MIDTGAPVFSKKIGMFSPLYCICSCVSTLLPISYKLDAIDGANESLNSSGYSNARPAEPF